MTRSSFGAVFTLLALVGLGPGCNPSGPGGGPNSFTEVYAKIIGPRCTSPFCHFNGIGLRVGALDLSSRVIAYWNLIDEPVTGPSCALMGTRVVPFDPEASIMYQKVSQPMPRCGSRMPADPTAFLTTQTSVFSGDALSPDELKLIYNWIADGAPNN